MPSSTIVTGDDNPSPEPATAQQDSIDDNDQNATNVPTPPPAATATGTAAEKTDGELPKIPSGPIRARGRSSARKPEPTLLHDFLLGRPSAARLAAERKRRESVEAVKAELRHEMKQSQVRKLQPPNGVRARVKAWQKANADAIAAGAPEDAASEPTDVAFDEEEFVSVTEEDRIRIKMRQKKRGAKIKPANKSDTNATEDGTKSRPPRRRIVSDDHWVKPKVRKISLRRVSPRPRKTTNSTRIPNGFAFRATPNPSVSTKVKAWAENVEIVPPPRSIVSSVRTRRSALDDARSEDFSDVDDAASVDTARRSVTATKLPDDDGIRVTPIRQKPQQDDDGIRVTPMKVTETLPKEEPPLKPPRPLDDDGIRVKPLSPAGSDISTPKQARSPVVRQRSKTMSAPSANSTILDLIKAVEEATELSRLTDDLDSYLESPTKRTRSKSQPPVKRRSTRHSRDKSADLESTVSDDVTTYSANHPPSIMGKSVADLPGEIPFGHSAFSELDLPIREPSRARSKPKSKPKKADRTTSLRGMPNVLKKVVEEGKKMLQDMNEPPRHALPNNPPSIEKWLSGTVDALETGSGTLRPIDDDLTELAPSEAPTTRRKSSQETKSSVLSASHVTSSVDTASTEDVTASITDSANSTPKASKSTPKTSPKSHEPLKRTNTPPSNGLRRSRATRSSTQLKPAGKRPLLGVLKEAFQGESSGHSQPIKNYQSHEERKYDSEGEMDSQYMQSNSDLSSWVTESQSTADTDSSVRTAKETARLAPPRLRPPTNGNHELSTILSESSSGMESERTASDAAPSSPSTPSTPSTLTQSTAFTKETESGKLPQRQGSGLKRRLTKHSDLVSVLSAPDDSNVPERLKSNRSRPSIRKTRGVSADVTNDELLREFADDENWYQRELRTLVDGVIPVLLSHVIGDVTASELFGPSSARDRVDSMSKAVVNMGLCLDKLKSAHQKAPTTDLRKLGHWAHGVVPIYNNYLTAWRLGFQDLVVNLAPRGDSPEDEDSLLNLLPRNEAGDVINADGERVAVAYLLKRPLVRIKQMSKLIQCIDAIYNTDDTGDLLRDFEALQAKTRRRHREELARLIDEEAVATDKTRARDLRTLNAAKFVNVDAGRQVSAKDIFSLDLVHSNGQRLECQVELVHRDKQNDPDDEGDLLIREVGDGNRSYLLFPPIAMSLVSARAGDGEFDLVVMIRGSHNGKPWYELLNLYADEEEQILDWIDILPSSPVPAREPEPSIISNLEDDTISNPFRDPDVPIGAQSLVGEDSRLLTPEPTSLDDLSSLPSPLRAPPPPPTYSTVEREDRAKNQQEEWTPGDDSFEGRPLKEDIRPDPVSLKKSASGKSSKSSKSASTGPYQRGDGAPPPPIHRTLSPSPQQKKSQSLKPPPVDLHAAGIKRRGSSPLKHEYLPSDVSSVSASEVSTSEVSTETEEDEEEEVEEENEEDEETETETETEEEREEEEVSDIESSDDELESLDIPQTELGYSIKKNAAQRQSFIASECSLTPSNSASQAGLHGRKSPEQGVIRYMASISRWTEKGAWKDVSVEHCSIIVTDGLIEAFTLRPNAHDLPENDKPLLAMDLTPLVLIRQSTAVDLEIRSSLQSHCKLAPKYSGGNFRFRCLNSPDCYNLYMAVHHARLHNQKFIQLENEARFRNFGERLAPENDGDTSSRKRNWFGRKNSYRSSIRAPSNSNDGASTTPSSASASSFLRRLTLVGNFSFNLARSSVDKHSQSGSGRNSLYTTNSGSSSGSGTPPRSPSVSVENSGNSPMTLDTENIRIRLHLLVSATKWEDHGNCSLQIRRPPPGWHQALRADHGLEKRVTVTTIPKKSSERAVILLDAVLGSGCFSPMGTRGIVCGIWEELKDKKGVVGKASATGPTGGNIKKWCFQFSTVGEANWVLRLVHQEVITT